MALSPQASAVHRFCRLPTPSYEKIYADANTILDDIISHCHTFRKPNQDPKEMVLFMSHGCEILQNATILLRSKFAQVINIYLPIIKNFMDETCFNSLVLFLCQSLTNSKSSLVSEFMKTLAVTLPGNGPNLNEENLVQLLGEDGIIWMYLKQDDWIVRGYTLQCLGNICLRTSNGEILEKQYIRLCYSKLLDSLRLFLLDDSTDIDHLKLINVALKASQNVLTSVTMNDGIIEAEFNVALLKIFLTYGAPGYRTVIDKLIKFLPSRKPEDIESVKKIYPTKKKEKSPMTKKVHTKKPRKKKKKGVHVNLEESFDGVSGDVFSNSYNFNSNWRQSQQSPTSSSESEFSDSESGYKEHLKSVLVKIRQNAATTIQDTLRCCDRRSKFSCWLILAPDSISESEPSLLSSLAMEHSVKVRPVVLLALMELIDGSKGFLDSAVSTSNRESGAGATRPFTPFSVKLNRSLHLLHDTLLTGLERENTDVARDKVVKCIALLMLNTPYKKIGMDYLPDIVKSVCSFLHSTDVSLCQTTLTCLAACMSVQPDNWEVYKLLQRSAIPRKGFVEKNVLLDVTNETSWLVIHCLQQLSSAAQDSPCELRLSSECIQLLTVVLRCHPVLIRRYQRDKIIDLSINVFLFSSDLTVSLHAIKILEEISKYFAANCERTNDCTDATVFWKNMLTGAIPQYLHVEPVKPVKGQAAICDWISNIGSQVFSAMNNPEQIFVKTILIGLASSEEAVLSAAAVRALGVIIDYTCMQEDIWFVVDATTAIIQQLDNPSVNVRLKAAWSLANLCDFISKNGLLNKDFPEMLVVKLLEYSCQAALDNEKVSSNGVRALGNILKAFPKRLFEKECFQEETQKAIDALIKNITTGPMKSRWNACYACRYMMENLESPIGSVGWTEKLYNALLEALSDCKNFKVRISAASALCAPLARRCYGDEKLFSHIWSETLNALEKSDELTDFTEFKHKDTLQDQTTILLLHLLSVATAGDLSNLRKDVQKYRETFLRHCERCADLVEGSQAATSFAESVDSPENANELPSVRTNKYPSTEEGNSKKKELERYMEKMKTNLCSIAQIKATSTMDILRTALFLLT